MTQFSSIDIKLLEKYDRPGPRYTSYPTAPVFTSEFGPDEFHQAIRDTNGDGESTDLSLYYHIPFCERLCYFCGCTMMVTRNREKITNYVDYLEKEMSLIVSLLSPKRRVTQLHWGGGTPTYLTPDEILRLGRFIQKNFRFSDDVEAGCEVDPRGLLHAHLAALRETGFNRLSMGVQDFDAGVQKAVNRIQPEDMTRRVVEWGRELGFKSINLDFIYGLPGQTMASFEKTVDILIDISPDRIAVFNYAHVPWLKKHQKVIRADSLPKTHEKLMILKTTIEKLSAAGYWYIGMDHFAKPDDELAVAQRDKSLVRNFQGYSTKAGSDLYAFGISGISQFRKIYAQNHKELATYYRSIDGGNLATRVGYRLSKDDEIRRAVIMKLMCDFELRPHEIERSFGIDFKSYFRDDLPKLKPFINDGLLALSDEKIEVTSMGRLVIRNIAMSFDHYLDLMETDKQIFSKTI